MDSVCIIAHVDKVLVATIAMFLGDMEGSKVGTSFAECMPLSVSIQSLSSSSSLSSTP